MSITIFSSNTSQQAQHRWVDQLNNHFIVYVESPPSIFQVPQNIVDTNPVAYLPQEIGIGPYHHFRRDLDVLESRKLGAIRAFLNPEQFQNFKPLVVDKVRALEASIRSCYDKYLDLDGDTLAWAMAIDGVYLLHLLSSPNGGKASQDVWMLENQFPCIVLNEIVEALFQPPRVRVVEEISCTCRWNRFGPLDPDLSTEDIEGGGGGESKDISEVEEVVKSEHRVELVSDMASFCRLHSPIDYNGGKEMLRSCRVHPGDYAQWDAPRNSPHILDMMYRLVFFELSRARLRPRFKRHAAPYPGRLRYLARVVAELTGLNPLELIADFPWEDIFANNSTNSSIEKIQLPSASQLHKASKTQFQKSANGFCLKAVEYERPGKLFLPEIKLNVDSEVILRNLVAYESALGSNNNVVSSYVDLMCGLIETAADVDLLKENGIIVTALPSGEVVKMFNGINKSSGMVDALEKIRVQLNETYDSTFRVRCSKYVKNHLIPSNKSIKIVLGILLVVWLILEAFCNIYGCSDHW